MTVPFSIYKLFFVVGDILQQMIRTDRGMLDPISGLGPCLAQRRKSKDQFELRHTVNGDRPAFGVGIAHQRNHRIEIGHLGFVKMDLDRSQLQRPVDTRGAERGLARNDDRLR
jgi:hypothetical protein